MEYRTRMADPPDELEALKAHLASLTARVYRLEQTSQLVSEMQTPTTPGRPPGAALQPPPVLPASVEPLPSAPPQGQPSLPIASKKGDANLEKKIGQYWLKYCRHPDRGLLLPQVCV